MQNAKLKIRGAQFYTCPRYCFDRAYAVYDFYCFANLSAFKLPFQKKKKTEIGERNRA
jgi:hypothetical protein